MDKGKVFERLMLLARKKRLQVQFLPLQASYGILCNDRIGIANNNRKNYYRYNKAKNGMF
ncbi:MAG: hypothetical protein E6731_01795 [Lachnospiraceae bacterium]|nr:hypothetical protein [Lachnospiraceae bacterium]